jgi:hypothetical protein
MRRSSAALMLAAALVLGGCGTAEETREEATPEWMLHPNPAMQPISAAETVPYRQCTQDTDCIVVQNGCCSCANGGEDIAIHRDRREAFQARFDCTKGVFCTEVGAVVPCGSGQARCVDASCAYIAPTNGPQ